MATQSHTTPIFSGRYDHALDNKNRITIPSRWRKTETDEFFIMPDQTGTFLMVMPPDEFEQVSIEVSAKQDVLPQDKRIFIREFYSNAQHCVADKHGRLLLPEEYCKQVALKGDVVLLGTFRRFEIWNPARRTEAAAKGKATFEKIANEVGL